MDQSVHVFFHKILSNDVLKTLFISVLFVTLHVSFLLGILYGVIILGAYILGFYAFYLLLRRVNNVGQILPVIVNAVFLKTQKHRSNNNKSDLSKEECNGSQVLVPSNIDAALEHVLNRVVNHYICNWYSNISSDPSFQYEIRSVFQNVIRVCYKRISRVHVEDFLLRKLLPIYLDHISGYDEIKYNNEVSRLHIAVHSRTAEMLYLQNVSKCLLKYFLPKSGLRCKSYYLLLREILSKSFLLSISDLSCNPAVLNSLLLYYLKGDFQFLSFERTTEEKVELLEEFLSRFRNKLPYSPLRPDVLVIMKDKNLLDAFMNYLKENEADIVLQFCIDIGHFIERISKPDMEVEELDSLYRDAWDLYSVYFSTNSPNCIKFEVDFASSMRKVLSKDVLKLRNTTILSEAQEQAYILLDKYCFGFHCSSHFYSWLYGPHDASGVLKYENSLSSQSPSESSKKTVFELSSKLNKIKDVLKPNTVQEGQALLLQDNHTEFESTMTEMGEEVQTIGNNKRNINMWNVNIPTVGSRQDPITNKAYTVFIIQVQTDENREWLVERRPIDFYSLDVKLTEFHGPSVDAQLPPKRLLTTRIESIQLYEEYLNKLIRNPVLKNSELLYTFLTSTEEFVGEDTSLSKLFRKSVVPALRKERGQNLEGFLNTFITSCRMTKYEWKDVSEKSETIRNSRSLSGTDLYENYFNISADISQQIFFAKSSPIINDVISTKISSLVLYIGSRAFGIRRSVIKFLLSLQPLFGDLADHLLIYFTKRRLCNILTPCNIVYFINFIERNIFDNRSKLDNEIQNRLLTELLNNLKNSKLHPLYVLMHNTLQDPKMNKQLYYKLMDAVLIELFPELEISS